MPRSRPAPAAPARGPRDARCNRRPTSATLAVTFRQRIASVPLGLGRPRWTDDTKVRLSYHLRHNALPAPGGAEQLSTLFARILEQPLDRGRPLWRCGLWRASRAGASPSCTSSITRSSTGSPA
ncbi:MAG: hypothetical protein H0T96_06590 [Thermoleophilaceae bacterium]|nr:hypothetical protein [Thermoleophilaceae bacterium]